jgi:hypothetical protein
MYNYIANSDELIDDKTNLIEINKKKTIVQSTSFATISNVEKSKPIQNKYSVDNFYDLETSENAIAIQTNNIDDTNNNNHRLANLNENKTIIQQPSSKSPSFQVKVNNNNNHDTNQIVITSNNLNTNTNTITNIVSTPRSQKIARQSLIHKNDVFQFDDVDSVRTSDLYFKSTPQSSFESEDTCKSSFNDPNTKSKKNKDFTSSFKKKTGFFRPLTGSTSSSKIKKSSTSTKIVESGDEPNNRLERSNTFTRHLSSLKRIFNSKQSFKTTSHTDLVDNGSTIIDQLANTYTNDINNKNSLKSIPVIINSNTTSTNKQLTISVNNNSNNSNNLETLSKNTKDNYDTISIPPSNSNTSFTIRSHSNENIIGGDKTEQNIISIEKKTKIFNLKFGKNKKNKTKN